MRGTIFISRLDIRWLPKTLSCVFRTFCSPKTGSILNPQSMWTTAKNISLSAKCMPGQMRRLHDVVRWTVHDVNTVYTPSAKCPVVTFPWILRVYGFRRWVFKISLWLKYHVRAISCTASATTYHEWVWIWVHLRIMVHSILKARRSVWMRLAMWYLIPYW